MSGYAVTYWPSSNEIKCFRGVNDLKDLIEGEVYSETEPPHPVQDPKENDSQDKSPGGA